MGGAVSKYSALGNPKVLRILQGTIKEANLGLLEGSQATPTWNKHSSALNSFEKFTVSKNLTVTMPYTLDCICNYVSWALLTANLKPNTVRAYLTSISTVHKLRNL